MPVSIRQVAAAAGVSVATVSHVLNGKGTMAPQTRQKVQEVIRQLGYQRKRNVGSDLAFLATVPLGFGHNWMSQAAAEYGFTVHVTVCDDKLDNPPDFDSEKQMAGIIISGGQWKRTFLEPIIEKYPTVLLGSYLPTTRSDAVWVDNAGGIYVAVDHLVRHGHRYIGLINGPEKSATSAEKRIGFERALRHANLQGNGVVVETVNFAMASGRVAALRLLAGTPRPTGIVAGETSFGLATVNACRELGLSVPGDLSLVTFNDKPSLTQCNPPVSALTIPELAICREAMSRLVLRISNRMATGQRVLLEPELIQRSSVAVV